MACTPAAALPTLLLRGNKTHLASATRRFKSAAHFANLGKLHGGQRSLRNVIKAVRDSSGTPSGSIVKVFQDAWSKSEDRVAIVGLGFAGIAVFWASSKLVAAIDNLPLVPSALEFVGILYSWFFIYRYLLFKPDREELAQNIKKSLSDILK